MSGVAIDFEGEGLLEGAGAGVAREARLELLRTLENEGFTVDELRRAAAEDRLALLPVERVLEAEGPRYTQREVAEAAGVELDFLRDARRALGQPDVGPDERALTAEDLDLTRQAAVLMAAGLDREGFLELTRVMSQAMGTVASSMIANLGQALIHPGDTERDLGLRYADTLRQLGPLAGPALQNMLSMRMREQIRQAVIGQAELESGRLPGAQDVVVGFVDIVGFTELGEQVPADELGRVIGDFERRVEDAARVPVRVVKTIGDAAMLVAPAPDPLLEAMLGLVESSGDDPAAPLLRAGSPRARRCRAPATTTAARSTWPAASRPSPGAEAWSRPNGSSSRPCATTTGPTPDATASRECATRWRSTACAGLGCQSPARLWCSPEWVRAAAASRSSASLPTGEMPRSRPASSSACHTGSSSPPSSSRRK